MSEVILEKLIAINKFKLSFNLELIGIKDTSKCTGTNFRT
jgi:hypothetical protein